MFTACSFRGRRSGQTVVEFALVLPVLLLILLGIMEFGRIWMTQNAITNAAREGARKAVLPSATQAQVETLIHNYLSGAGLTLSQVSITCTNEGATGQVGDDVTVGVDYNMALLVGNMLGLGGSLQLSSSSVMRHE